MDKVECTCNGENPNCRRCFGTGLYEPLLAEGLPRPSVSVMARLAGKKSNSDSQNIPRHSIQAPEKVTPTPRRPEDDERGVAEVVSRFDDGNMPVVCRHCAASMLASGIGEHTRRVHPGASVSAGTIETVSPPDGMVYCPYCFSLLKRKNLHKHLRIACAEAARPATRKQVSNLHGDFPKLGPEPSSGEGQEDPREEVLSSSYRATEHPGLDATDGTTNIGQSFRDHGQFGSHPSFDGMDDESKP